MSMNISSVGFYDCEGTYFLINGMNGFPADSYYYANGVHRYVARLSGNNNHVSGYTEIEISAEQAQFLSDLFDTLHEEDLRYAGVVNG